MKILEDLTHALGSTLTELLRRMLEHLPSVMGAVLLLLLGLVVARVLRALAMRAALTVDRLMLRFAVAGRAEAPRLPSASARIFGNVVFWVVVLFFMSVATRILGLDVFTAWLSDVVNYIPALLAGGLIIVAGYLLSNIARDLVTAVATTASRQQRELLGRLTQAVILVTAVLVGADQIGIKVDFLVILAACLAGTVIVAVALAVSLGSRNYVANLIGAHHMRQGFYINQTLRIAGHEGRLLDITAVSIVLDTSQGRVSLPGKLFNETPILVVMGGHEDERS